jgi:hypothetical protein
MTVNVLVAFYTKGYQILGRVITQPAPRLNVMDLKTLDALTALATPAISLQAFAAELAISLRVNPQALPSGADPSQTVTWTFSSNCFLSGFGRPITTRVREGNSAPWFSISRLTPARKSAQIISRQ